MTTCPEELLERSFEALDPDEQRTLTEHAKSCPACALELGVKASVERRERAIDPARVARAVRGAMRPKVARLPKRRARYVWMAAAAVLVAASAAAAIHVARRAAPSAPALGVIERSEPAPTPTHAPAAHAQAPITAPADSAISIEDLPRAPSAAISSALPAPVTEESAAALFAEANQKRKDGDVSRAIALYKHLEERFPTSNEASVAHVTLGRVYDSQGDAAKALDEYDRYLAAPGNTALREEALVGRARACSTLGRADDERRAWETLLREYPDSTYAAHARERVGAPRP